MPDPTHERGATGLWLVGARGAISTCVAYGLAGLCEGLLEPIGLCTATEPFARLPLVPFERIVLGGHDVCSRSVEASARELVDTRILRADLVAAARAHALAFEGRIRPGPLDAPDAAFPDLDPRAAELGALPPRSQIERIAADLAAFREQNHLARAVVLNVASTEAWREPRAEWSSLEAFERALDSGAPQPVSILYAYAALANGAPYVNFTPSRGASIPALRELALRSRLPHAGSDGKTGETLLKTVLAPMFRARALRVRSWQGYNMLGNRDGEVLSEPAHRQSKLVNKDEALRSILDDPSCHTGVGIDYVPSLRDWKTAWDFVHFEGFLGTSMSLQFTWSGSDSALAAPLALDLARLADFAAERGESGVMEHTASFFKAPLAGGSHDFHEQFERLVRYAEEHLARPTSRAGARGSAR